MAGTTIGTAYVQILPSAEGIGTKLKEAIGGEADHVGASVGGKIGSAIVKAIAALGIGKMIGNAITNGMDFEQSMAKTATLFSGTSEELAALESQIMSISGSTGVAASQLAEAAYSAESASVPMQNLGGMIEASAKLATAGFTDIDTALSATAKTMNAYGMMSDDVAKTQANMEKVQRVLIQTQNKGITTVGELGASLAQVTPTAAAANVGFEQVGAALALMTARGTPTAQATTQLRSALAELEKSGTTASKALTEAAKGTKYAGMSFTEMMASGADLGDVMVMLQNYADKSGKSMLDLWGSIEGGNAAMAIAADVETFNSDLEAMSTDADVVGDAFSTMSDTVSFKLNQVKNTLKNIGIKAFAASADTLMKVLEGVENVLEQIQPSLSNLKSAFSNLFNALGQAIGELLGLDEGFSASEAIAAALKIVIDGLAKAIQFLADHMDTILPILAGLAAGFMAFKVGSGILSIIGIFTKLAGVITAAGGLIPALAALIGPVGLVAAAIAAVVAIGIILYKNWDVISAKAKEIWGAITTYISQKVEALKTAVTGAWDNLKTATLDRWNAIKDTAMTVWNEIKSRVVSAANDVWTRVTTAWNNLKSTLQNTVNNIKSSVVNAWESIKSTVISKVDSLKSSISTRFESIKTTVSNAVEKLKSMFNFNWELPHIKLPHFSLTGKFSLAEMTVPHLSVEWYKKAYGNPYLFTKPTLMGFGDGAGGELVYGHENLLRDIRRAVQSEPRQIVINQTIQSVPQSPVQLAAATEAYFERARWALA